MNVQVIKNIPIILHNKKIIDFTEPKYQKSRDISIATMCLNPYPIINLPHRKFICIFFQRYPPFYINDYYTIPHLFMPYTKYHVYKNITGFSIHDLYTFKWTQSTFIILLFRYSGIKCKYINTKINHSNEFINWYFYKKYYIPSIEKLKFHLSHVKYGAQIIL